MSAAREAPVERPPLAPEDAAFDELPAEPGGPLAHLAQFSAARLRGRLAHALLLAGPRGSGKRHAAVRLAQLLACERGGEAPCRRCAACSRVERGLDTDLFLLEPAWDEKRKVMRGEITVEQVRALQERLTFRSSGARRVVIVDPADRLSLVAQEAVLKTLEEPPAGVTLLLLTARPSALKPTIRSRAHLVRFVPPSEESLAALVAARTGRSPEEARVAAALASGDVRRALGLDPAAASARWMDLARALHVVLGPQGEAKARDLALQVVPKKAEEGDDAPLAEGPAGFLDLLEHVLGDVLRAGELGTGPGALRFPGGAAAAAALSRRLPPERAAEALSRVAEARRDLDLHCSAKVVLTHLLLQVHALRARGE